jgi:hypothetical protein
MSTGEERRPSLRIELSPDDMADLRKLAAENGSTATPYARALIIDHLNGWRHGQALAGKPRGKP